MQYWEEKHVLCAEDMEAAEEKENYWSKELEGKGPSLDDSAYLI